jgi:hypothetical protein
MLTQFPVYFIDLLANVKQVLSIVVAVTVFNTKIGFLNGLGIIMTLFGGACYRYEAILFFASCHRACYPNFRLMIHHLLTPILLDILSYVDFREKAQRMRPPTPAFPQVSSNNGPILTEKESEELQNIRISNQ